MFNQWFHWVLLYLMEEWLCSSFDVNLEKEITAFGLMSNIL